MFQACLGAVSNGCLDSGGAKREFEKAAFLLSIAIPNGNGVDFSKSISHDASGQSVRGLPVEITNGRATNPRLTASLDRPGHGTRSLLQARRFWTPDSPRSRLVALEGSLVDAARMAAKRMAAGQQVAVPGLVPGC
jgi:hypothetical protein